jgi:RNA polymerase primary sigma factor
MADDPDFIRTLLTHPLLTREEEHDLITRWQVQRDAQARDTVVRCNQRWVARLAQHNRQQLDFEDAFAYGQLGLLHAIDKFDCARGNKFSTYATMWIWQAITRGRVDGAEHVPYRLPIHQHEKRVRLYRAIGDLEQTLGGPPTIEQVASYTGLSAKRVTDMLQMQVPSASLDTPLPGRERDMGTLGEMLPDEHFPRPDEVALNADRRRAIDEALNSLDPREATILRLRFGLRGDDALTLDEVGAKYGLTRERIRQIEAVALKKLRHPSRARLLRAFA